MIECGSHLFIGNIMETLDKIKKQISENPILIYMKGSPKLPSCGFS
ncbi:glutaredoxin, partial [Haemophilus haemolyticus]